MTPVTLAVAALEKSSEAKAGLRCLPNSMDQRKTTDGTASLQRTRMGRRVRAVGSGKGPRLVISGKEVMGLGKGKGKEEEGVPEGSRGNVLESGRSRRSMLLALGLCNLGRGVWWYSGRLTCLDLVYLLMDRCPPEVRQGGFLVQVDDVCVGMVISSLEPKLFIATGNEGRMLVLYSSSSASSLSTA
jgi:hypothetical protein